MVSIREMSYCVAWELIFIYLMNCNFGQYWTSSFRDMTNINWSGNWYKFMTSVLMASPVPGIPGANSLFCDVTRSLTVFWMIRRLGHDNTADGGPLSGTYKHISFQTLMAGKDQEVTPKLDGLIPSSITITYNNIVMIITKTAWLMTKRITC